MKNLQLDDATALKMYPGTIPEMKAILEQSFGKQFFSGKVTDRVKTADDAFKIKGISIASVINDNDTPDEIAYKIIKVIVEVLNEGWVPDWKNDNQYKYYPWFDMSSGSGLSYGGYVHLSSDSCVGSRLCFKSRELAEYAGKQFIKEYTDFFIIK